MSLKIEVKSTNDEGDEVVHTLPAKYEVCSNCEGHGTHMNESMRSHGYTEEEFEQDFSDEMREEYFRRGGIYDVPCETCKGRNVVLVVNRNACLSDEHKRVLAILDKQERDEADYEQLVRSEIAYGC